MILKLKSMDMVNHAGLKLFPIPMGTYIDKRLAPVLKWKLPWVSVTYPQTDWHSLELSQYHYNLLRFKFAMNFLGWMKMKFVSLLSHLKNLLIFELFELWATQKQWSHRKATAEETFSFCSCLWQNDDSGRGRHYKDGIMIWLACSLTYTFSLFN